MPERIDIPESTREAWQKTVDIVADVIGVPAALIVRARDEAGLEVFVASQTPGNVFSQGETIAPNSGLFCEQVIAAGAGRLVANAAPVAVTPQVAAARRGMVSYLGLPLFWPDGRPFGTICVMDSKENGYSVRYEHLLKQFQDIVNHHLTLLFQQHELKERTRRDALTGACTRREFFETGRSEVKRARRYGHPMCLLLLDLDNFKLINDQHGHAAGDQVLKLISRRVMDSLRTSDRYYRFGGEEFVVILPHSEIEDAELVAERIRVLIETRPVEFGELEIPVTVSIGISLLEGGGETLDDVVAKADKALYMAKEAGRNCIEVFERLKQATP